VRRKTWLPEPDCSIWPQRVYARASAAAAIEYTHELVAETYALLMTRRHRKRFGKPPWLDDEIYSLLKRVTGWSD
jgi:hypothetical protein